MSFGGGYAMLPVIEREVVDRRGWMSREELEEGLSVAATAPGGIAVNAAAYVGYRLQGWPGLIAAVLGIALPTFLIVLVLGIGLTLLRSNPKVVSALAGIQAAVVALIAYAAWKMMRAAIFDVATVAMFVLFVSFLLLGVHPALIVLFGIGSGVLAVWLKRRFGKPVYYTRQEADEANPKRGGQRREEPRAADYFIGDGI
jgi:chromate transporter